MQKYPALRKLTSATIYLNAAIWFGLGLIVALDILPTIPEEPLFRWGMVVLSWLTSSLMIALYHLSRRWRPAYYLLIGIFVVITFLAFADDFGWVDLAAQVINVLALVLLILKRAEYLRDEVD
ncbi:MAG: hypothetical protein PVG63_02200 [Anaerolineales bacterium]|jgi:hypothetical protein